MNYNLLGKSDLSVSQISFGCMSLGTDFMENNTLLKQARDQGINFFDTADVYQRGENEITVGRAFKGIRDTVVIATKVGNQWKSDGSGFIWNPTKAYILQSVEKSLQRLQTHYIDLYQLHGGTLDDPIDDIIEAFEILKQQGKIRHYGISSIRPNVIREYVKRSSLVSVMMQYSLLDRRPEESCLDLLHENKIGVLARGTLAKGLLVDKPAAPFLDYTAAEVEMIRKAIAALSHDHLTSAAIATQFVLNHPAITSAVIGVRTTAQLHDVLTQATVTPKDIEKISTLKDVLRKNTYDQHR